jgi:transposase-like protein
VRITGEREVLGTEVGRPMISNSGWTSFARLVRRGLRGVRLATSGSHHQAVAQVLTGTTLQRCRVA